MLKTYRSQRIIEAVMDCGLPLEEVARRIGKPYATLMRELSPYDSHAKLGMSTLVDIVLATGNAKPFMVLAEELGLALVPRTGVGMGLDLALEKSG